MEKGIIQLFPAFAGSADTGTEEMTAYVKEAAGRFCQITGLVVIDEATVPHERGIVYILGEEGEKQGIIAIGNVNNASYYYRSMFISRVGVGNTVIVPYSTNSYNQHGGFIFNITSAVSLYMKYIKDDDTVIFRMGIGATASTSYNNGYFCLTLFRYGDTAKKNFMVCYGSSFYASYNNILGNEVDTVALFAVKNDYAPLVPDDKEAVADIYISNAALPYMKLFTNKKNMAEWSVLQAGGGEYAVMVKPSSGWTVLVKLKAPSRAGA